MLYSAGAVSPPPAPAMSRPHNAATDPMLAAASMPQGLRELDVNLFLDALVEVLCDKLAARARAAHDALSIFTDTVLKLHHARTQADKQHKQAAAAAVAAAAQQQQLELTMPGRSSHGEDAMQLDLAVLEGGLANSSGAPGGSVGSGNQSQSSDAAAVTALRSDKPLTPPHLEGSKGDGKPYRVRGLSVQLRARDMCPAVSSFFPTIQSSYLISRLMALKSVA